MKQVSTPTRTNDQEVCADSFHRLNDPFIFRTLEFLNQDLGTCPLQPRNTGFDFTRNLIFESVHQVHLKPFRIKITLKHIKHMSPFLIIGEYTGDLANGFTST